MATRSITNPAYAGSTLAVVLRDFSTGAERLWNATLSGGAGAFEAYNASNVASYAIAATEGSPGVWRWTVPAALAAGSYEATAYIKAGGSLATSDLANAVYADGFAWSGTAVLDAAQQAATAAAQSTAANGKMSGITSLRDWLRAGLRKSAPDATALAEINTGGGTYDPATDSAEAVAETTATGNGARTITVVVKDPSAVALQNARVRFTEGANTFFGDTNASGNLVFNLNDATYTLAVTKDGFTYAGSSPAVTADATINVTMTPVSLAVAPQVTQTTAYLTTYDAKGNTEAAITLEFRLTATTETDASTPTAGRSFPRNIQTATSDSNGLLQITLLRAARYQARRLKGAWVNFTTTDTSTFQLPEVLGKPGE